MHSNVMLRFLVQALQDPPFCSSTVWGWPHSPPPPPHCDATSWFFLLGHFLMSMQEFIILCFADKWGINSWSDTDQGEDTLLSLPLPSPHSQNTEAFHTVDGMPASCSMLNYFVFTGYPYRLKVAKFNLKKRLQKCFLTSLCLFGTDPDRNRALQETPRSWTDSLPSKAT